MPVAEPRRARPGTDPARRGAYVAASPRTRRPPPKPSAARPAPPKARASPKAAPRTAAPKAAPSKAPTRTAATRVARRRVARIAAPRSARLPSWGELGGAPAPPSPRRFSVLDAVPSLRLAAWALVLCTGMTLYVGHVYATRATVAALQEARRDNLRLHLTQERLRSAFDRMTGPAQILPRAAALGLEEGVAYAPPIHVEE